MASVLSPLAAPFHPSISMHFSMYNPSEFNYIYSDGVPVLAVDTNGNKDALFHGISDEAIDEAFPLTEDEEAELEMVYAFTEILAELSILEETEEESRRTFYHIKKRWEARREEGVVKVKPMKADHKPKNTHHHQNPMHSCSDIDIRSSGKKLRSLQLLCNKHVKEERKHTSIPKNVRGFHSSRPIHQPRKN